jgi:hypothetical protein
MLSDTTSFDLNDRNSPPGRDCSSFQPEGITPFRLVFCDVMVIASADPH